MPDTIRIQLRFSEETKFGHFEDVLFFTEEEWEKRNDDDIAKTKQERINKWVDYMENPPSTAEPTKEELQAMLVEFEAQTIELERLKIQTQEKIDAKLVVDGPIDVGPVDSGGVDVKV